MLTDSNGNTWENGMKRFYRVAVAGVLAMTATLAMASTGSLTAFTPRVMPVLVRVNSHGKVTNVSPSTDLSPAFDRLLASSLDTWISKPGVIKGRAVDTEMIVNVALRVAPREGGKYDATFAYVSSSASPYAASHGVTINGNQLTLADDHNVYRDNRFYGPSQSPSPNFQRYSNGPSHSAPVSAVQSAAPNAVSNAPAHGK